MPSGFCWRTTRTVCWWSSTEDSSSWLRSEFEPALKPVWRSGFLLCFNVIRCWPEWHFRRLLKSSSPLCLQNQSTVPFSFLFFSPLTHCTWCTTRPQPVMWQETWWSCSPSFCLSWKPHGRTYSAKVKLSIHPFMCVLAQCPSLFNTDVLVLWSPRCEAGSDSVAGENRLRPQASHLTELLQPTRAPKCLPG